jgi:hypothetical protein
MNGYHPIDMFMAVKNLPLLPWQSKKDVCGIKK